LKNLGLVNVVLVDRSNELLMNEKFGAVGETGYFVEIQYKAIPAYFNLLSTLS